MAGDQVAIEIEEVAGLRVNVGEEFFLRVVAGERKFETFTVRRKGASTLEFGVCTWLPYAAVQCDLEISLFEVETGQLVGYRVLKDWRDRLVNEKGQLSVTLHGVQDMLASDRTPAAGAGVGVLAMKIYVNPTIKLDSYDRLELVVSKTQNIDEHAVGGYPTVSIGLDEDIKALDKPSEGPDRGEFIYEECMCYKYTGQQELKIRVTDAIGDLFYGKGVVDLRQLAYHMARSHHHDAAKGDLAVLKSAGCVPITNAAGDEVGTVLIGVMLWHTGATFDAKCDTGSLVNKLEERARFDERLLSTLQDPKHGTVLPATDAADVERNIGDTRNMLEEIRSIDNSIDNGLHDRTALKKLRREQLSKVDVAENFLSAAEERLYQGSCDKAKESLQNVNKCSEDAVDITRRCKLQLMTSPRRATETIDSDARFTRLQELGRQLDGCKEGAAELRNKVYAARLMVDIPPSLDSLLDKDAQAQAILRELEKIGANISAEDESYRRALRQKQLEEQDQMFETKPVIVEPNNLGCFTCCCPGN